MCWQRIATMLVAGSGEDISKMNPNCSEIAGGDMPMLLNSEDQMLTH